MQEKLQDLKVHYAGKEVSVKTVGVAGFTEFLIRKGAHLTEYFILGFLVYRALDTKSWRKYRVFITALFLVTHYAASDEFYQVFTYNRTSHIADVILDSVGGLIGIGIALLFYDLHLKFKSRKEIN